MTAEVVPFRRPLPPDRALAIIRAAVARSERLGWCDHAHEKMLETGIVTRQVLTVMEEGALKKNPTWSEEYSDWACVLRKSVSGRTVHVVVGVQDDSVNITIITVY